ncbi:MAG: hypothetical protein PHS44_05870 [Candidatus Dojkabacteria bacterium]|jgi:hypothetical protein|nr:hypothetical protein [Candidatus Dojkabacteria bacterium]
MFAEQADCCVEVLLLNRDLIPQYTTPEEIRIIMRITTMYFLGILFPVMDSILCPLYKKDRIYKTLGEMPRL